MSSTGRSLPFLEQLPKIFTFWLFHPRKTGTKVSPPYTWTTTMGLESMNGYPINVYPNPTSGLLYLEGLVDHEVAEIAIYDMTGKKVKRQGAPEGNVTIDINELNKGIYLLQVHYLNGQTSQVKISKY